MVLRIGTGGSAEAWSRRIIGIAPVSKTGAREGVWVRIPPAPLYSTTTYEDPSPGTVSAGEWELPKTLPATASPNVLATRSK